MDAHVARPPPAKPHPALVSRCRVALSSGYVKAFCIMSPLVPSYSHLHTTENTPFQVIVHCPNRNLYAELTFYKFPYFGLAERIASHENGMNGGKRRKFSSFTGNIG
jgi:hypothetical protein